MSDGTVTGGGDKAKSHVSTSQDDIRPVGPAMGPEDKFSPMEMASKIQSMFTEIMIKTMEDSVKGEEGLFGKSANAEVHRAILREELAKALNVRVKAAASTAGAAAAPAIQISNHPVDRTLISQTNWSLDPITNEVRIHSSMDTDTGAPVGSSVRALADGLVVESGVKGEYGNSVVILTDDGRTMLYAHNDKNLVKVGDRVTRGDAIALVGSGRSTGASPTF